MDARDGEVYEFAAGDGTAESLSYTYYQGYVWILYSNEMNSGYKVYHMERYDGADSKVNEMDFSEEYRDENDPEKGLASAVAQKLRRLVLAHRHGLNAGTIDLRKISRIV